MAGRPRDPDLEARLLAAAWSLLLANGYDELTIAKIAVEANAHRSDIYRRWASKAELVTAAVAAYQAPLAEADTGSLLSDLRAALDTLEARWSSAPASAIVAWLADVRRDPAAGDLHHTESKRATQALAQALRRAVERGEISAGADFDRTLGLVCDLLEGPVMHNHIFLREPLLPGELDLIAGSVHRVLVEGRGTGE
ncbi:TetR/AcrR family transcriptional regulator [Amycolatopsis saalfeldensis]|uniref:DNA-binding transcriptional regulator, AcrR family n=1 Tax=Amycolatopsis saalfeldensis TaxID=394193 RepID=A0A1H8XDR5_9PSEU|nr:TetR/AcrR family transcriptional regulator [Amycolatopsis saalfeldensis]SEP37931.1 DNA-binding transcriptional regulator, AcrR family [Amycolatopsis saalfeldensis]